MAEFGSVEIGLLVLIVVIGISIYLLLKPKTIGSDKKPAPVTVKKAASEEIQTVSGSKPKPKFKILFGSQSGTAESYAEELRDEAIAYGVDAKVVDLEEYDPEELEQTDFCVLLMATFGEGEPTDNAATFWEWLHENGDFEETKFRKLTFSVFALGNRQWEHFCNVGKVVHELLKKFGGNPLLDVGLGDDDGSMENDFAEWKTNFWAATKQHFGLEEDNKEREVAVPFVVDYVRHPNDPAFDSAAAGTSLYERKAAECKSGVEGFVPDDKFKARLVTVAVNRELRADTSEGNTRHGT
jgi:NADPH-ferrihemoprotein reductase